MFGRKSQIFKNKGQIVLVFTSTSKRHQQGFMFVGFIILVLLIALVVFVAMYSYQLNDEIVSKFENRRWDIPATVYSRPLILSQNSPTTPKDLEAWLRLLNYDKGSTAKTGSYTLDDGAYIIHTRGFDYGDGDGDPAQLLKIRFRGNQLIQIQSTKPTQAGQARLEPVNIGGIYPENNEDRILLTKDTIPKPLIDALIATEDRDFYHHYGVSVRGISRALVSNLTGGTRQGGSTITQQLIKNFYLSSERTLKRKANEAIMALLLERHYTKEDILVAYMNEINLGQNGNRSVNGFGIASEFYFDKPLSELRLDQYALLVGIAKGSSYYNPRKHPERAKNRRDTVLHNMLVMNVITQKEHDEAVSQPLSVVEKPTIAKSRFPDFLDVVQRELKNYYKEKDLRGAGLKIISTLDPIAQRHAENTLTSELKRLGSNKNLQGALVSADPKTGELIAIVGGAGDFTGFNRATDAKRQVGSLLKPVIYLTALQSGQYNLASFVKDEPKSYSSSGGKPWIPENYSHKSYGNVPLMTALANSYNQSAVNVGMEFGLNIFQRQMHQFGAEGNFSSYPATLLGAVDMSAMQMLGVYQVFASGGYHTPIHAIRQVISEKGKLLQRYDDTQKTTARFKPEHMYLIDFAMQKVISDGTAKSALSLGEHLNLAGKTGTTNDARDAWFAGFSGNYVSVVWVGRDDNKPIGLTGGSGALPIWIAYMKGLTLTPVQFTQPDNVQWLWLENGTGKLSDEHCSNAVYVPVLTEFLPTQKSDCISTPNRTPDFEDPDTSPKPEMTDEPPILPQEIERMNADTPSFDNQDTVSYGETDEAFF